MQQLNIIHQGSNYGLPAITPPGNLIDMAEALAADASGSVYVTGTKQEALL
jgi:hypothetical protein